MLCGNELKKTLLQGKGLPYGIDDFRTSEGKARGKVFDAKCTSKKLQSISKDVYVWPTDVLAQVN